MKIDIIGDIHGCYEEFRALTKKLGYVWTTGLPVHPEGRNLGFVGDLTDRGHHSLQTISTVYKLLQTGSAYYVPGNHCNKLYRYFLGNNVKILHGLETTVAELSALPQTERDQYRKMFLELYKRSPLYHVLDEGRLIIAHAGIKEELIGKQNDRVKTFVLYGDITGEKNEDGTPVRKDWARDYKGDAWIVYGHTPVKEARMVNKTVNIDTGAVFGGKLTALRYPEIEVVSVASDMPLVVEKFRDLD
ncbi:MULTISPECIES: bis(5'-nucleosyl)-tetraphosphatase PrpE [Bacillaceae]|uniref:bis(5'-nucleosyl)-tetraphosphatase PrpE n=1 Tax=Bacillaceae TaxID=186817 RepID=UPI001C56575E|nr:bis(5'-nucleosyl)-tetraphosphatase PrpE [Rossellomorea sp. YZS02]MBW3114151.1 bis(5'-nucleosyl)-tetraphosphatase PrpE [Bacillus sp. MCCB 382]MDX8345710.1 bis(5'-nucleosyl)-tetraphosphatase PrpE [Rossellomorea sp. YZS02]